jgi:hypothetical protein
LAVLLNCAVRIHAKDLFAEHAPVTEEARENLNLAFFLGRERIDYHCDRTAFSPCGKTHFREITGADISLSSVATRLDGGNV